MRNIVFAALYTALAGLANPAVAQDLDGLRTGDMRKLIVHSELARGSDVEFTGEDGSTMTMADYEGKWVVLNFWATWCAPCRVEMPHLSQLQTDFGGDDFEVVTIATGRNQPQAMQAFLDEIGVDNLPLHTDPRQALARDFGVLGLPVTVILTPDGQEFARLQGEADWSAPEAYAVFEALLASD
ncbi:TlpA family protein disulfide reductase [Flavimaricola marinus]|uniref:Thiol:disulfide interchange protein TlpA n=1 Tax=Flavimaricola marinus TaxID=1819565 RepID=A0A238LB34_9RHOB|nr:TlpA disulfide reductase family protein [Flavimaricola marinus]SMY06811.1 Thiol:disulfide interchange protein TlpA [Flavimaricola marinus]